MKLLTTILATILFFTASATDILVRPYGGGSRALDYDLEQTGYSTSAHTWPGSDYNPAFYQKTVIHPGDNIVIRDTAWSHLLFWGVTGTAAQHINVITQSDAIIIFQHGLTFTDCQYIDINGIPVGETIPDHVPTISERDRYRIRIVNTPDIRFIAYEVRGRSKCLTAVGLYGHTLFYGAQIKTDPTCDTSYNRNGGWVMDSMTLRNSWFEDVSQDVIYTENSSNMLRADDPVNGRFILCDTNHDGHLDTCQSPNYLPMLGGDGTFAYLKITRAGRQGFVIGGYMFGKTVIHDNDVSYTGYELNQGQGEGVGLGGNNINVYIYNNFFKGSFLYGIADFGNTTCYFINNTIDSSGYLDATQAFSVNRPDFLRVGTNLDSLCATYQIGGVFVLSHSGSIVANNNAGGVYNISSTTKVYYPTTLTKTSYYKDNKLGACTRPTQSILAFENFGPAVNWTTNTLLCHNTALDGATPITVQTFLNFGVPTPTYRTQCIKDFITVPRGYIPNPVQQQ